MSRIASYASQQLMNSYLRTVQERINDSQTKIATQSNSQDYTGIGTDTSRLLSYEVDRSAMQSFITGNENEDTYIKVTSSTLTAIEKTFIDFKNKLTKFNSSGVTDQNTIDELQSYAFTQLQNLQSDMNTSINGKHLFSGQRTDTPPVDFSMTTLAAFQNKFDGISANYPNTHAKNTETFNADTDSTGRTNWLTFDQDIDGNAATAEDSRITSTTAQFANVTVGSIINITGTANNNGTYEVTAVGAGNDTIDVKTVRFSTEAPAAGVTLTSHTVAGTTILSAATGALTFDRAAGTMTAANASTLTALTVGTSFNVAGTTLNDGNYVVTANTGTAVTVEQTQLTDEGDAATPAFNLAATSLAFTNNATSSDRITGVAGQFTGVAVGMDITFGGTVSNNATFRVSGISTDGSYIEVSNGITTEAAGGNETAVVSNAVGTIKSDYYYQGDNLTRTHRVSKSLDYTVDVNAGNAAFERGIRAFGIIAQGKFGTSGGLEQTANTTRITDAINLLTLTMDSNDVSNPQYEADITNNMRGLTVDLTYQRLLIDKANASQNTLIEFFGDRVKAYEEADELTYISLLTNDKTVLEASYAAVSLVNKLNLQDYLG